MPDPRPLDVEVANARWRACSPLACQLPLRFPSGELLEEFELICADCHAPIKPHDGRGALVRQMPTVVAVEAWGLCRRCGVLSHFDFRFRDGLVLERRGPNGWTRSEPRPPSLLRRAWNAIRFGAHMRSESGLVDALERASREGQITATDILATGWARALGAELAQRGWRKLAVRGFEDGLVRLAGRRGGRMAAIQVGPLAFLPDGDALGPLGWRDVEPGASASPG